MIIRLANEKDREGVYKTIGYCFNNNQSSINHNIQYGDYNKYEQFIVALDDNENVESVTSVVPFQVYFEGKKVNFGGIAGVSSLPENRGSGNIAGIISYALKYMKEKNMILSGLGPFAFQFYRKFGYEWCYTWQLVTIPIDDLKNFPAATTYKQLFEEDAFIVEEFRNEVNQKVNGPILRDERIIHDKWASYTSSNSHVYAAYNDHHEMVSYMVFSQSGREIKVSEMYFKDEISRQYLLNFLYRHRSMVDKVELTLMTDDEIRNILPSPRINYWHWPNKMGRVVMVKEALELLNIEDCFEDSYNLKVLDLHADWNNKTFNISCQNGHLIVKETNEPEDFEISIQRLSQITLGHLSAKEAVKYNFIKILNQNKTKLLYKSFSKRTTMLWQEF